MAESSPAETPPLAKALSLVASFGPPIAVVTALLVYFGWARSDAQSRAMGLDVSLFGYTPQDYVLRSIRSLFLPLVLITIVAIAWLAADVWLTGHALAGRRRGMVLRTALAAVYGGSVAAGAGLLAAIVQPGRGALFLPYLAAAGVLVAAWGVRLRRHAAAEPRAEASGTAAHEAAAHEASAHGLAAQAESAGPEGAAFKAAASGRAGPRAGALRSRRPAAYRALESALVFTLVTLLMFWGTADFAQAVGRGLAVQVEQGVGSMPRVTLFSRAKLAIGAPNVTERSLGTSAAPLYSYLGLRLLVVSGGRFFLLHDGWTLRSGTVVVLPDDDTIRVELGN
ncbi:hypothetical protein B5P43_22500 [Bacillus sp. SRB_336]|nr:hypothetical protein B5P43_22500 [Bacillus sp. SRB_336]